MQVQTLHTPDQDSSSYAVPVVGPRPVGLLEWHSTGTRLYGVDSIGQVFVFHTTPTPPVQTRRSRLAVRFLAAAARLRGGPEFS